MAIDINKIVETARAHYAKGDKGLSRQLTSGVNLVKPSKDSDFVLWENSDYWQRLTNLRGLPFGKIIQISGKPDSGKSSTAACFMASAQRAGTYVILWDAEQKFQATRYDKQMGGDSKSLLVVDTNSIEDGAIGVAHLVNAIKAEDKSAKILIVYDSVGASLTKSENASDDNESMSKQPAVQAKEINWAIKKFNRLINQYQNRETGEYAIAVLIINQVYAQLMVPGFKEKGGDGLFYLSSIIVQLTRKKDLTKIKAGQKIKYGIVSRAKVRKNHLFDGEESLAEMDIVVSASGIHSAEEIKKKETDVEGWNDADESGND
jgi:RecA/RadA recombinase